jgi:hypothetical protein
VRLLREPLLHFLLIGLGLFLWFGRVAPDGAAPNRIVVSQAQVDALARQFAGVWSRPPQPDELRGLVDSYVRDEMLYREGESLGLGSEDPVIKRRVRQKYEVLSEELQAREAPTEADLQAYLDANPDPFRRPARVSFEQVLVVQSGDAAGPGAASAVAAARRALERGADPAGVGRPTLLPLREEDVGLDVVARDFGERFAQQLESVPLGAWAGPVDSGFGLHLVRVAARTPGTLPPLAEIRPLVSREWESARRRDALEANLKSLRAKYDVVIEARLPGGSAP